MNSRRMLIILAVIVIAALLAIPLRSVADQLILLPLAYVFWALRLIYVSVDQRIWWIGVGILLFFSLVLSLLPAIKIKPKVLKPQRDERGSVEALARILQKTEQGVYFKWLAANRLGKLAYQILLQREHGKPRSVFAPLTGEDWEAKPEIQKYLEKGLQGSFAEFPSQQQNYFSTPEKTPLDVDIQHVIEFLESKQ